MDLSQNIIAIVDDDSDILLSAKLFLKKYFQEILCFSHPSELFAALGKINISVVLLDLNYQKGQNDGKEGLGALEHLKTNFSEIEVVMMTAYVEVNIAVEAVKKGAFDFMVKPWQNEKLLVTIMNAVQKRTMDSQLFQQAAVIHASAKNLDPILGDSNSMEQIRELINQVAPTDAAVHIKGGAGSGKSLIAQHIHQRSTRSNQAFIVMDFSSLNEEMQFESLFGNSNTIGKWMLAKGGSIYLKEISFMSLAVQEKLLELLKQQGESGVRILSSSKEVNLQHNFQQELYYRLNTIEVNCPDLSNRKEDLLELLDYFLEHFKSLYRKPNISIQPLVMEQLKQYEWPGNVKELKRAIEREIIIGSTEIMSNNIIPSLSVPQNVQKNFKLDELEKRHIRMVLANKKGNIQQSAAELGISRAALYRRIEKYGLDL